MKIGIQGELGAYSHIAVENLYKDAGAAIKWLNKQGVKNNQIIS